MTGIVATVSRASAGTVTVGSLARPCSSEGWTSNLSWLIKGRLASTVGPVLWTPGISAVARRRSGGKAAFNALKAGIAALIVVGKSATAFSRFTFWRASAAAVVLKSL